MFRSFLILVILLMSGCTGSSQEDVNSTSQQEPVIITTNYPLTFFVEFLTEGQLAPIQITENENDPAYWVPDRESINKMQTADLLIFNGAGYEPWLESVSLPSGRTIITTKGMEDRLIRSSGAVTHSHGPEGEHEHQNTAFTTWLDPELRNWQINQVKTALEVRNLAPRDLLNNQYKILKDSLYKIDQRQRCVLTAISNPAVIYSHPVYQYFESSFKFPGVSLHLEPDKMPNEEQMLQLNQLHEQFPEMILIWESEPTDLTKQFLNEEGIRFTVLNPSPQRPEHGDYFSVLNSNLRNIMGFNPIPGRLECE